MDYLGGIGHLEDSFNRTTVDEMVSKIDIDDDNKISKTEFMSWFTSEENLKIANDPDLRNKHCQWGFMWERIVAFNFEFEDSFKRDYIIDHRTNFDRNAQKIFVISVFSIGLLIFVMKLAYKCRGKGEFDLGGLMDNQEIESKISIQMLK